MNTFLVAGGAGFIGSHLCEELLNRKNKVICVDNFLTSSFDNIKIFKTNPDFSFLEYDVTKLPHDLIQEDIFGIFHLASPASPNKNSPRSYIKFPIETLLANSLGTYNLLELARAKNSRFLYASTSEVYGDPLISPQVESYFGNVNPVGVRSVYDEGKRFGEAITMAYFRKYNLDVRIVRIFNTYGEKMQADDGRVVSNFILQALKSEDITVFGDGSQTRSFCYVKDMVDGLLRGMDKIESSGEVVNLGNPEEYTIKDIAFIIKNKIGSSSKIIFKDLPSDDPKMRRPNINKAINLLGFQPVTKFKDGLEKTIEYFRSKI